MEKLTRRQLTAIADYLCTHTEHRAELNAYLTAPADKKEEILLAIWDRYGDRITARAKL